MATVIGVRFKRAGKVYYFDPGEIWPRPDVDVVVETSRGIELGRVVTGAREVADELIVPPLKKVIRIATEEDINRDETNTRKEKEAYRICSERIAHHKLEMKLISVEYTFDGSKIIFYFTANGRVDFRELVKDLAGVFKMRIELRQIGVRDEAKMLGGLGSCGRPICCGAFLGDFQPVSIKMAKEQNLSLNPTKISGQCGRLMCCLKYEQDQYEEVLKKVPKVGREVMTPDGVGTITEISVIKETVRVRMRGSDDSYEMREYPVDDVRKLTQEERQTEQANRQAQAEAAAARQEANRQRQEKREAEEAARQERREKHRLPKAKTVRSMNTEEFIANMAGGNGVTPKKPEEEEQPRKSRRRDRGERPPKGERVRREQPAEAEENDEEKLQIEASEELLVIEERDEPLIELDAPAEEPTVQPTNQPEIDMLIDDDPSDDTINL